METRYPHLEQLLQSKLHGTTSMLLHVDPEKPNPYEIFRIVDVALAITVDRLLEFDDVIELERYLNEARLADLLRRTASGEDVLRELRDIYNRYKELHVRLLTAIAGYVDDQGAPELANMCRLRSKDFLISPYETLRNSRPTHKQAVAILEYTFELLETYLISSS